MSGVNCEMGCDSRILVTGAAGFIGTRVVASLLRRGFRNLRCLARPSSKLSDLQTVLRDQPASQVEIQLGNLLSAEDCRKAVRDAKVVYHLVTGRGKSFPSCFQNSVVTTRNLLEAMVEGKSLARLVNVSSFAVYSGLDLPRGLVLDENCPLESNHEQRHDAYVYAKLKQDELIQEYHKTFGIPYVTVRPGVVIGPGKKAIPGSVGMDTFGFFLHLGGSNRIPLTYVDNCADAIVLAGLVRGVEGQVINVVDDDLPSSRYFLNRYKSEVGWFPSVPVPYPLWYLFCVLWEIYARKSQGQLPPVFNRRLCAFQWKKRRYSNQRLKQALGWSPQISMSEALHRYYEFQRQGGAND